MAVKVSERVKLMKEGFMELHNRGMTIPEIADYYEVAPWTVYDALQNIADANGVARESLLQRAQKSHVMTKKTLKYEAKVNPEELSENFSKMIKDVDKLIENIDEILEKEEEAM